MKCQEFDSYFDYDYNTPDERRKHLVVIIYDIMDNKRRAKLAKYLQSFGFRVQRSAFECILDQKRYNRLVDGINKFISKEDLLRIYRLSGYADVKLWGSVGEAEIEDVVIL